MTAAKIDRFLESVPVGEGCLILELEAGNLDSARDLVACFGAALRQAVLDLTPEQASDAVAAYHRSVDRVQRAEFEAAL